MRSHVVNYVKCECGVTRIAEHPIPHCPRCQREAYDAVFAALRQDAAYTHLLGVDPYSDCIYVAGDGVVLAIEGRADRALRTQKVDDLVRRITDLETENRDVLAENARLRRRLDGSLPRLGTR